jgi:7,8-dihydropterin-6-yl-methyl-4-(beta-D-ribofuranosyl)aminobenzene 5'-phosphate synthase
MQITTLMDNRSLNNNLLCEHGLALFIELNDVGILFDAGQSNKFMTNAEQLNIDLSQTDFALISHGHYDHSGGIPALLKANNKVEVLLHPLAIEKKFSRSSKMMKENGIPWIQSVDDYRSQIRWMDTDTEIAPGVWIITSMNRYDGFRELDQRLVLEDSKTPDPFSDEVALLIVRDNRPILLTGCAHNGIVNILNTVKDRMGISQYELLVGGLHLNGAQVATIEKTLHHLEPFRVKHWALNHCTGDNALTAFKKHFGENKVSYAAGGTQFRFDE